MLDVYKLFIICLMFIPPPALLQKSKQAPDRLGVWVCLVFIYDCVGVRRSQRCDFTTLRLSSLATASAAAVR